MCRVAHWGLWLAVGFATASCTQQPCDLSEWNPAIPTVLTPIAGRIDLTQESLRLSATEWADPDPAHTHARTEYEIWNWSDTGATFLVWHALFDAPQPALASMADGDFTDASYGLNPWTRYAVRVRQSSSDDRCEQWSEWSPWREFRTDDGSRFWFDPNTIANVYLTIPPDSWPLIDAESVPPDCVPYTRNYYSGSLRVGDKTFDHVGIRAKGGCGTGRHLNEKTAFKVYLSWNDPNVDGCPRTRRVHGLQRLTLNNMAQDPSFLHERLAYAFFHRMGIPSPRANHVRVHVNGELWGLYLNQESIDRRFLARWFPNNDGMLYEATYQCDLVPKNVPTGDEKEIPCMSMKFQTNACTPQRPGGDSTTFEPLRELISAITALPDGELYPAISEIFDFDLFLTMWATEVMIDHWDGYVGNRNNYRIYHDPLRNRWTIIPAGTDQTFTDGEYSGRLRGLLSIRCLSEPACKQVFGHRLRQVNAAFARAHLDELARTIRDQISADVQIDPRREGSFTEFETSADEVQRWITTRPAIVDQMIIDQGL